MILSDASKLNREQLQQNLSLRVRLFKRTAEATAVGGSIAMATGIITLSRRSWVKRVRFEHEAEGLDVKIWFSHDGATFQLWHTEVDYESDAALDLPVSIYCKYLKVKGITEAGEEIEAISDTWLVYDEATFDISGDVRDGVTVERKKDRELGFYVMPYASIPLDNTHGYFHKRNTASPYWDADHGKSFLRSSARIFVEAMYKGPDGRLPLNGEGDPDWIPVVMFEAQRFRNNAEGRLLTVSGYGAKVLLRGNTTQPVHELITPVDLVKDWLVRDDDTGRLLVPVNPASRQVTQTKFSEFVGRGRTFAGNWWDALPIEHGQVMSVPGGHPASYNDDSDAFAVVTGFADGTYKRTGICTDGSFLYALLCFVEDQNNDTDWFIEKMDFEGNVVGKLQVDTPGYFEYMADITTDGEYLYYTVNRVHVNPIFAQEVRKVPLDLSSAPSVLKRWSYYENPAHPPQALYGITFVNEESATHPGRLIIFSRVLTNLGGYSAADLLYVMNRSTGSYDVMNNSALGAFAFLDYMDQVTDEFIVLHSEGSNYYTLRLADVDLDWRDELVEFASTLPDKGGAIFSDRKKFIFLLRTDLGIGKVAEFGYWLENANLQYTGIAGFDRPLLYLRPVILLDGQATEADGTVTDALLTTDDYALNLRTGQLRFRFLLRDGVEIRAHYDYVYSLRYVRIEDKKRIEALNDVGISNNFQVFLDETGEIQFRNRRYEEVLPCPTVSQDLLPDETVENNWTVLGGPTAHGVLADESDDTYLHTGVVLSKRAVVGFENPAYPFDTGERVKLRVRARMSGFEVRLLTITIRDGGSFIVSTVLNLGINFEWYELLGPVGYVPGSNGANLRAVLDTGDYHSIDVSQCRMVFPMESVQSKRLGDPYQDGGLDYIVHPSNPAHRFNTVRVSSVDRVRRFVEGADFTIAYTGNRSFITFLDTETVRESEVALVTYYVQQEIPVLKDVRHIVQNGMDEEWGDDQIMNDVSVEGELMLPADNLINVEQVFAVSPNETKQTARYNNIQEARPEGLFDWNVERKVVEDDGLPEAKRKFFLEFEQPFVLGTSHYEILYGDARDGGSGGGNGQYGILVTGTKNHSGSQNEAHFQKVSLGVTSRDLLYYVMVDNVREWRLATDGDFGDMAGHTTGGDPANAPDVKTTAHFYLKQMNGNYGKLPTRFVAYYTKRLRFFVDREGRVIEDPLFSADDPRNPFYTVTPDKRIAILLTPEDERQNPLFELHGVSGSPGYFGMETPSGGFNYFPAGLVEEFSMRVKRVQADMLGVNFDYDSWSTRTLFVRVQTAGYPLTRIEQFVGRVPATEEDLELYGLRERTIESNMIQNIEAARNLARSVKSFKDHEPSSFAVEVLVDFGIYIDMLINVQEGFSGVDDLFDVVQATHGLNGKSPSTTRLQLEEVDLS